MQEQQIVSIYTFNNNADVDREAFIDASNQAGKALAQIDGCQYRSLGLDAEGRWVDVVYWESADAAAKASDRFMASPTAQKFMGMIDQESLSISRIEVAHSSCGMEEETA